MIFLKFLFFRIINSFLIRSNGAPDEIWQSQEIAHSDVFKYGFITWEWKGGSPIRSPLFHSTFSILFWILKYLKMDYPILIAYSPKIIQAFFAALFDYYLIKLTRTYFGEKYVKSVIFMNYCIWFSLFSMVRTYVNCFEAIIFMFSLYKWRVFHDSKSLKDEIICRFFVTINFIARPTSLIPWIIIWPIHFLSNLLSTRISAFSKGIILFKNILNCFIMIITSIIIDSIYYKKFVWTTFNFVDFNILKGGGSFYGQNSLLFFFENSIPFILEFWIPFFIIGLFFYSKKCYKTMELKQLEFLIILVWELCFLSLSSHKEDRFLMPIFPMLFMLTARGLKDIIKKKILNRYILKFLIFFGITSNIAVLAFHECFLNTGSLNTLDYLRNKSNEINSVYFFTDCHQTPFYSHIHKNITLNFAECPPLLEKNRPLTDKEMLFFDHEKFIKEKVVQYNPSHIVILSEFYNNDFINQFLVEKKYIKETSIFHSFFTSTPYDLFWNLSFIILSKTL